MEVLHVIRFWAKWRKISPCGTQEEWSVIYAALQRNPGWRCGCPHQALPPGREDGLRWLHREMGEAE